MDVYNRCVCYARLKKKKQNKVLHLPMCTMMVVRCCTFAMIIAIVLIVVLLSNRTIIDQRLSNVLISVRVPIK